MNDTSNIAKGRRSHGSKEMIDPNVDNLSGGIVRKEKKVVWAQTKTKEGLSFSVKPKMPTFVFFSVSHVVDGTANEALLYINFIERSIKLYIDGILCRRINFPIVGRVSVKSKTHIDLHLPEETIHFIVHKSDAKLIHNILFHIAIQRIELIPFDRINKYQTVLDVVNEKKRSFFSKSSIWKVRTPKWILVYPESPFPHLKQIKDQSLKSKTEKHIFRRSVSIRQNIDEKKTNHLRKSLTATESIVGSKGHISDDEKRKHQHKSKEENKIVEKKVEKKDSAVAKRETDEHRKVTEKNSTKTHSKDDKSMKNEHSQITKDAVRISDGVSDSIGLKLPSFPLPLYIISIEDEHEKSPSKERVKSDHHEKKVGEKPHKHSHREREGKEKSHKSREDKEWHTGLLATLLPHSVSLSREAGLCPRECEKHFRVLCRLLRAVDPKPYVTVEGKKRYQRRQHLPSSVSSSLSGPSETDTRTLELTSTERRAHFAAEEEYEAGVKEVERQEKKMIKSYRGIAKKENPKNEYEILKSIGKGGYGSVYTASRISDGVRVAVKVMHHEKDDLITVATEIVILEKMKHENILGYIDSFHYHGKTTLITEYLDGGSLKDHLSVPFNESDIAYVLSSVLRGLSFMHKNGFIHRDIKSANIMFTSDGKVKIIDLGLAVSQRPRPESRAGSKPYMAPEVILMRPYGAACDVWSVGCVAQEMAELLPPYREFTMLRLLFRTATVGAQGLRKPETHSAPFRDFVSKCFVYDQAKRPSADVLLKVFLCLDDCCWIHV